MPTVLGHDVSPPGRSDSPAQRKHREEWIVIGTLTLVVLTFILVFRHGSNAQPSADPAGFAPDETGAPPVDPLGMLPAQIGALPGQIAGLEQAQNSALLASLTGLLPSRTPSEHELHMQHLAHQAALHHRHLGLLHTHQSAHQLHMLHVAHERTHPTSHSPRTLSAHELHVLHVEHVEHTTPTHASP